jgi:serine/threonine protein kinase
MTGTPHLQTVSGTPRRLGRFELEQVLGRGAQAAVWLARDTALERQVALKLLHAPQDTALPASTPQWLQEARSLSRLVHPHIVTLYEADVYDARPGLVLEWVNGPSLDRHLQQAGPMAPVDAVRHAMQVLRALQHAHEHGVVHRDLKPSNILLAPGGQAKVTDFGLATHLRPDLAATRVAHVEGTPGYLSPEAALGEAPRPVNDVFAAGLVLAEMLLGHPLLVEADPYRAIYRVAHEDLQLPQNPDQPLDDALRAVVQRALARDPSQRYASAADMLQALEAWLQGHHSAEAATAEAAGNATLDFLLRRMRRNSDFPAMSAQILKVLRLASSENESLNGLTSEILKDVALTHKLLRTVNSAHFSHVGGGSVSTVSRAVSLIGFAGIRNLAMSLVLLDHMENKAHANQLKAEFIRGLLAASLATDMAPQMRDGEELFIGALFQGLGRMLTEFYFPDEARQIRLAMAASPIITEEQAAHAVLGLGFEALGQGVAQAWGLPASMMRLMRKPEGQPPHRVPVEPAERMRWLAVAGNALAEVFLKAPEAELNTQLHKVASRFSACVGQTSDALVRAAHQTRERLASTAEAMGLALQDGSPAARLMRPSGVRPQASAPPPAPGTQELRATTPPAASAQARDEAQGEAARQALVQRADQVAAMLATGIQDVSNALLDDFKLNDVLHMILETMYRALGCRQVLLCLKNTTGDVLQGRLGLGEHATDTVRQFKVVLGEPGNLFAATCAKGMDTLIRDAHADNVARNLPQWYRQSVQARSFILLPMQLKGAPMGLIYADQTHPDGLALNEKGLALLKTLRNQAVMAFRQATHPH